MENNLIERRFPFIDRGALKITQIICIGFIGFIFVGIMSLLFGFLLDWVWNVLMPELFGLAFVMVIQ